MSRESCRSQTQEIPDRRRLLRVLRGLLSLRHSPRLYACRDIIWLLLVYGEIGRYELVHHRAGLARCYGEKMIGRALRTLVDAGLIRPGQVRAREGAGRSYRLERDKILKICAQ